jgi:hypothetical protein
VGRSFRLSLVNLSSWWERVVESAGLRLLARLIEPSPSFARNHSIWSSCGDCERAGPNAVSVPACMLIREESSLEKAVSVSSICPRRVKNSLEP